MNVIVIDAQGGGVGKQLIEQLKRALPEQKITAVGTNALATAAMLRAGADQGATGENAVRVCAAQADLILGPMGLVLCDAMLGEITPAMAVAVGASSANSTPRLNHSGISPCTSHTASRVLDLRGLPWFFP